MNKGRIVLKSGTHSIHVEAYECPECGRLELVADANGPYRCEECAASCGHAIDMKSIAWCDVSSGVWNNRNKYLWDVSDGLYSEKKMIRFAPIHSHL